MVISSEQIEASRKNLPERPDRKFVRFMADLGLDAYQSEILTNDRATAEFYERVVSAMQQADAGLAANWVSGELFGIMNANGSAIDALPVSPGALAGLLDLLIEGKVNNATAKIVLDKMIATGQCALEIIDAEGLAQISDREAIAEVVRQVLAEHPNEVQSYREGKISLRQWFFGQVMRQMRGKPILALCRIYSRNISKFPTGKTKFLGPVPSGTQAAHPANRASRSSHNIRRCLPP